MNQLGSTRGGPSRIRFCESCSRPDQPISVVLTEQKALADRLREAVLLGLLLCQSASMSVICSSSTDDIKQNAEICLLGHGHLGLSDRDMAHGVRVDLDLRTGTPARALHSVNSDLSFLFCLPRRHTVQRETF
jgi:hypothetical protein